MEYKNARYTRHGKITCEVKHPTLGWIPYTASKDGTESFSRDLFNSIEKNGNVKPFKERKITNEEIAASARKIRDDKLIGIDAVVSNPLRWESFSEEQKDAYRKYRQELLDVPQQPGFPKEIVWPELKL